MGRSYDCPNASEVTPKIWENIHAYQTKAKQNDRVHIFTYSTWPVNKSVFGADNGWLPD